MVAAGGTHENDIFFHTFLYIAEFGRQHIVGVGENPFHCQSAQPIDGKEGGDDNQYAVSEFLHGRLELEVDKLVAAEDAKQQEIRDDGHDVGMVGECGMTNEQTGAEAELVDAFLAAYHQEGDKG